MANLNLVWQNDTSPALNEDNLNALTQAVNANTDTLDDISDTIEGAEDLIAAFDTSSGSSSSLVVDDKINTAALTNLLENVAVNADSETVSLYDKIIATAGDSSYYTMFNMYSAASQLTNISTLHILAHYAVTSSNSTLSAVLNIGSQNISIGSIGDGADIDFFDRDSFDYVDIELLRLADNNTGDGYLIINMSGYESGGYNRREVKSIISAGQITAMSVSWTGFTQAYANYVWSADSETTEYTVYSSVNSVELDNL